MTGWCDVRGEKTQALNVNLTVELRRYVKDQVRAGRYQNENEVVRDAICQMQQREISAMKEKSPLSTLVRALFR